MTDDYTDFVKRLRFEETWLAEKSADAIEAQAERIAEIEAENERLIDAGLEAVAEQSARIAELEAVHAGLGQARHIKRGSTYDILGEGIIQTRDPLIDMDAVVIYRCRKTGKLWARQSAEFYDGRFEIMPPARAALEHKE